MMDVTLRLEGRTLHLVHRASDCDFCRNRRAHTTLDARPFVRGEIERAVRGDASALAGLRDLVAVHAGLPSAQRAIDAEILEHIAWLLETARLLVVECIEVRRELPDVRRARPPARPSARPRSAPVDDEVKTWIAIELLEEKTNKPMAGARYVVKGPSGPFEGALDAQGRARIDNIDPGTYDVSFPDIDGREWKKA